MGGVLVGFAIIAFIILVGYLVGRLGILGPNAGYVLNRIVFFVLSPALLFTVLAKAPVHELFSSLTVVSLAAAVVAFTVYLVIARLFWRRPTPELVIGSLAAGYVNANNIGIPVAVYVLGSAAYSAPVVLLQLLIFAPIALTILDATTTGRVSLGHILRGLVSNPLIIGSALGVLFALTGVHVPAPVLQPFVLLGDAAVPVVLLAFGMSLHGQKLLQPGSGRRDVLLASAIKLVVMPAAAWLLGRVVFGLGGHPLFVVVALAALPAAQNVFNYASRYGRGEIIARDAVLITTIGSIPVLVVVAALLGG
ncbi:AEC family transporter [Lacisediminihabitans changchengi]|uniref:AEC family transporter n=1 Tax=Lacisediminihabitans changchengi TaxID=2787634 RepID=A0A934ST99_9MICO|nr:AEC family transporter [Lacisediminihabitans changchengi]MBK4348593.1 AEC family transporter [Lacisediminihabitans changchengi]